MKRISYNLVDDLLYTFFWLIIISTFLAILLQSISNSNDSYFFSIFMINVSVVPLGTFFIGLRPLFGLFSVPDTIYLNFNDNLYLNRKHKFKISDIKELHVKTKGASTSYFIYYEIYFNELPDLLKNRKRKMVVLADKYNIKFLLDTKPLLLTTLVNLGLKEDLIIQG